jgi:hypothetical protein
MISSLTKEDNDANAAIIHGIFMARFTAHATATNPRIIQP